MPKLLLISLLAAALSAAAVAGDDPLPPDAALLQRAEKIVATLQLADSAQSARVSRLVAGQYAALRPIHDQRDTALKLAKEMSDKKEAEARRQAVLDTAAARLADRQFAFVSRLSAEFTPAQVEQIKDGMTFGVLPLTFRVYQQMLPDLTAEQKIQILAWLTEAREHAMTAGSSEEKHGWFGKYKGRINNYLSKAGYNMKDAEKNLKPAH